MSLPISVCMAFFNRAEAAEGLPTLVRHYGEHEDFEVNIVDDGSMVVTAESIVSALPKCRARFNVAYNDPPKPHPLNPVLPLNMAVAMAKNEALVITNPEVRHVRPVFAEMLEEWRRQGQRSVICAACWAEGKEQWYQHGVHYRTGYHHCNLIGRTLFDEAGGFDLDYRMGAAYDDTDFVQRLHSIGATFVFRDDLVVNHINHPQTKWTAAQDNEKLFFSKWPDGKRSTETRLS